MTKSYLQTIRAASLEGEKESGIKKNVIDNLTVQY